MKAMILGLLATIVIAFGAEFTLERMGWSAADQGSSGTVRLGD